MTDIRIVPTLALTVTVIALLAFTLQFPTAALWAVVVALVLAVGGLFTLAAEAVGLRQELEDAERHVEALEAEAQLLHLELTETQGRLADAVALAEHAPAPVVPLPGATYVPSLQIVPPQRDGEHDRLAMSREEWAAIERETRDYS